MESKIILFANQLSEVTCKNKLGRNKFIENVHIRTKHRLPETFLHFNDLSLLHVGHDVLIDARYPR